ncbi:MAG: hypothetical protein ACXVB9_12855 [Bdellovibrionota bacterium]
MRFIALLFLLTACASQSRGPSSKDLPWGINTAELPEPNAIIRWSDPRYEESGLPALDDLDHVDVNCHDRHLYPTHPQQRSKSYHVFRVAVYANEKLDGGSPVCKISSSGAKKYCLLADTFEYAVISDLYQDACGGLYRGVWSVGFPKKDDNMGQLFSRGRTVYPKENAEYAGDVEDGQTYPLDQKDFLFVTHPFAGDSEVAKKLAAEAQATHTYDSVTHLFVKKGLQKAESRAKSAPIALEPKL